MNLLTGLIVLCYTFIIGLLLIDIAHGLNQLDVEYRHEKIVRETVKKMAENKQNTSVTKFQFEKINHDFAIIDELTYLARLSHLELITLKSMPSKSQDFFNVKLIASGNFAEFIRFISVLSEKKFIFRVNRFSLLMLPQNNISMAIEISVLKFYLSGKGGNSHYFSKQNWQDPFSSELTSTDHQRVAMIHTVDFQQIQFVGYLQKLGHTFGIVMLPNDESISVSVGDHLGMENAEVVRITEHGMEVRINHQEKWVEYTI